MMQASPCLANCVSYAYMKAIFIVSIHFPNLYVRDTESDCKNKKNIVNKRIMRVKNLISHNKTQQLFGNNFG